MSPWVTRLIVANVGIYLLTMARPDLASTLAFVPQRLLFEPWTVFTAFTYMFVHAGFGHILWNMIGLFFFGPRVEMTLGGRRFLTLYFVSGLFGALLSFFFAPAVGVVGASGAVFGVEFAYARFWPRDKIWVYFIPVEARVLVVIMVILSLFGGFTGRFEPGVAHFAHLGGFLGAAIFFWLSSGNRGAKRFRKKATLSGSRPLGLGDDMKRWESIPRDELHELNRMEVDRLLDKVREHGVKSLTAEERACLDRFSRR